VAQSSTQELIDVDTVREGVMVLKGGSLRSLLMCSSQNFALKSDEEQQATIFQFQNFLNSLDFHVQILVQSRKLNIADYLEKLRVLEEQQQNELLKLQTGEYRQFVASLVEGSAIMAKTFYVTISYDPLIQSKKGLFSFLKKGGTFENSDFERARNQLFQRVGFVVDGLRRTGIKAVPLNTSEIIELLWSFYNPDEAELGKVPEIPQEIY
jgi:type IV secretory pathway VirB4 component